MAHLHFHSESRIALHLEVKKHPALLALLSEGKYAGDDFAGKLGAIAAFCGVVVDGHYQEWELDRLADQLVQSLRKVGTVIITSNDFKV